MPRRPSNKQVDIDVVPYLSIMVIVLKLICLILVVTVMRIALNPHGVKAVSIENVFGMERKAKKNELSVIKAPTYMDCGPSGVTIYPGNALVSSGSFSDPTNLLVQTVDRVTANASNEYIIVLVRPGSVRTYRFLRKMLTGRQLDVGYDVFDSGVQIDYKKSAAQSGISLKE